MFTTASSVVDKVLSSNVSIVTVAFQIYDIRQTGYIEPEEVIFVFMFVAYHNRCWEKDLKNITEILLHKFVTGEGTDFGFPRRIWFGPPRWHYSSNYRQGIDRYFMHEMQFL